MIDDFDSTPTGEVASPDGETRKVSARGLTVSKSAPAPVAETPVDDGGQKGGKGGEGGQPPLPPSNAAFLASVMRDVPEGARAAVCSKAGDPSNGGWPAEAAGDVDRQCPEDRNNYLNCSSFVIDEEGELQARKDRFASYHFVLLDDVGSKVDPARLAGFTPTWAIETSPGNCQLGIRLRVPLSDAEQVSRLQGAIQTADLCDPGASGLARWARLPYAINDKPKHRSEDGTPFACRLARWNADVAYSVDELVEALGLELAPVTMSRSAKPGRSPKVGDDVFTPMPEENPVVTALRAQGLYKRPIEPGKHDITCPWTHEHTDGLDSGAAYFEPNPAYPIGGFRCQHSHGDRYHLSHLLDHLGVKPERARGKARIEIVPGELNRVRQAAEYALAAQGGYYQAGGAIVFVRTDPSTGDVATELVKEPALTSALADAADWYRPDRQSGKPIRCDPPARNVQALMHAQHYDTLPVLTGLARQPFFRERDGELVTTPGYDVVSGRYAAFDPAAFKLPEPTREAALAALETLKGLLVEFRFAGETDRAATICAMLTAAIRPSLPVAPAFNITASTSGSGKSYLASTIVPFAGPGPAFKVSYPATAEEATKTMLSTFLAAPAVLLFDDMQGQWNAFGAINRALTSDTITDRVLGVSRMVTVGTRTLILGTGNNIGPVKDMTRRVVTIRLHHRTQTPALQTYVGQPAEQVQQDRGRYVSAALTIIRSWQAAGSPRADVPSIASYGAWSDLCRQSLLWLGLPDPAESLIEQLVHDPDQDALGDLLTAWREEFGEAAVTLRQMVRSPGEQLGEALMDLPVSDRDGLNRSKLGWYLKRNMGRVVGGLELQKGSSTERNSWRVVAVEPEPDTPD